MKIGYLVFSIKKSCIDLKIKTMNKSILVLGAFILLLSAPTFAQEKASKASKTENAKSTEYKTVEKEMVRPSNEKAILKPDTKSEKVIKLKGETKQAEPVESKRLKTVSPVRKEVIK